MADEVIVLYGIEETLAALKDFDKGAVRRFNKVINTELAFAEASARASVPFKPPMSGWRKSDAANPTSTRGGAGWPGWNQGRIQDKIKKTRAQGRVRRDYTTSAGSLINSSAEGAIFEVAGRKPNGSNKNGFVDILNLRGGKASRTIWRIVDRDRARIQFNVKRALDQAKDELQRHLNRERA